MRCPRGVDRHGVRDQCGVGDTVQVLGDEGEAGGHQVGAVDQGEPLFGDQRDGLDTLLAEHLGGGATVALVEDFALADHGEHGVRQGGEIARGPDGARLGDEGGDAGVEQGDDLFDDHGADP